MKLRQSCGRALGISSEYELKSNILPSNHPLYTQGMYLDLQTFIDRISGCRDYGALTLGEIVHYKQSFLSQHEFIYFTVQSNDTVVAHGALHRALVDGSGATGLFWSTGATGRRSQDTIIVSNTKSAVVNDDKGTKAYQRFRARSKCSFVKLIIAAASVREAIPNYGLLSTNCYYFSAMIIKLAKEEEIIEWVMGSKSRSSFGKIMDFFNIVKEGDIAFAQTLNNAKLRYYLNWSDFSESVSLTVCWVHFSLLMLCRSEKGNKRT